MENRVTSSRAAALVPWIPAAAGVTVKYLWHPPTSSPPRRRRFKWHGIGGCCGWKSCHVAQGRCPRSLDSRLRGNDGEVSAVPFNLVTSAQAEVQVARHQWLLRLENRVPLPEAAALVPWIPAAAGMTVKYLRYLSTSSPPRRRRFKWHGISGCCGWKSCHVAQGRCPRSLDSRRRGNDGEVSAAPSNLVTSAQAEVQVARHRWLLRLENRVTLPEAAALVPWIPASAGMTVKYLWHPPTSSSPLRRRSRWHGIIRLRKRTARACDTAPASAATPCRRG